MNPHLTGKQIVAFRDGESTDPDVTRHLESCEFCRQEMESARLLANLLTAVREPAEDRMFSILDALSDDMSLESRVEERRTGIPAGEVEPPPAFPLELIQRSQSIGLLRVRQRANSVNFEYSPLEIDPSFLERPVQTSAPMATLRVARLVLGRTARPAQRLPFTFNAGEFRLTVEAEGESAREVRIRIESGFDDNASVCGGLEVTLIDSENAPRIFSLDQEGLFNLELRSMRSILLLHTDSSVHLGIELSK